MAGGGVVRRSSVGSSDRVRGRRQRGRQRGLSSWGSSEGVVVIEVVVRGSGWRGRRRVVVGGGGRRVSLEGIVGRGSRRRGYSTSSIRTQEKSTKAAACRLALAFSRTPGRAKALTKPPLPAWLGLTASSRAGTTLLNDRCGKRRNDRLGFSHATSVENSFHKWNSEYVQHIIS